MFLLLSGEGKSDMGVCYPAQEQCEGEQFKAGAMAVIVDQLVELSQGYEFSHLENGLVGFISEKGLIAEKPKTAKKSMRLRGQKRAAETQYYFANARALASFAKNKSEKINDKVVAVLFRDSDGTASAGRGDWSNKRASMIQGFAEEAFDFGVPMIPKPKSEAWLLCSLKDNPYQDCTQLEDITGNDKGQMPLKDQLSEQLNGQGSVDDINQMLRDKRIDIERIDMPSFSAFRNALDSVVKNVMSQK